jgi:hypothetical protein
MTIENLTACSPLPFRAILEKLVARLTISRNETIKQTRIVRAYRSARKVISSDHNSPRNKPVRRLFTTVHGTPSASIAIRRSRGKSILAHHFGS